MPALRLAQGDVERGVLDLEQSERIKGVISEVIDDLSDKGDRMPAGSTTDAEANAALESVGEAPADLPNVDKTALATLWKTQTPAVCVGARGPLDEGAAIMLAQLLQKHGISARVESTNSIGTASEDGVQVIYLSYLDTTRLAHMRYLVRRWRRRAPNAKIVLCCWQAEVDRSGLLEGAKPDFAVMTLREAVENCLQLEHAARMVSSGGENSRFGSVGHRHPRSRAVASLICDACRPRGPLRICGAVRGKACDFLCQTTDLKNTLIAPWQRQTGSMPDATKKPRRCRGGASRQSTDTADANCSVAPWRSGHRIYRALAMRKLSSFFPDLIASRTQCGCRPRPAHVCDGSFGFRYFGATDPRVPWPRAVPRVPRGSWRASSESCTSSSLRRASTFSAIAASTLPLRSLSFATDIDLRAIVFFLHFGKSGRWLPQTN